MNARLIQIHTRSRTLVSSPRRRLEFRMALVVVGFGLLGSLVVLQIQERFADRRFSRCAPFVLPLKRRRPLCRPTRGTL